MQKYYTTIEITSGGYSGVIYEAASNQIVYKTPNYPSQSGVSDDVNNFLVNNSTPTGPQITTNTTMYQSVPMPTTPIAPRKCCGRG